MKIFKKHSKHSYEGFKLPWYITLMWIVFFSAAIFYVVKFLILKN